jgi:hypothetical protein
MEDGVEKASDQGTPQGGSLSSLLSNVYLHYVLDLWFERKYRKSCRGECELVRFADDFVVCFQHRSEAERFLRELRQRLEKFNLQLAESKTKLLAFGRFARRNASPRGRKPGTFDFLGFTHYCGTTQRGYFKVKRKTSTKKFRAKLAEQKEWLKKQRHREKAGALLKKAKSKLEGHFNYYAITDNGPRCSAYRHQFERLLFKWLNRRSQRRSYTWEQFRQALAWVRLPQMRVQHDLNPCREVGPE